jgi:hydroxyethylthiazole kinase
MSRLPTAADAAAILERLRERRPRVHVITNPVAQTFTANMLLSVGAAPSMTSSPEEVPAFLAVSGSLLVNLGILDRSRRDASLTAIEVARECEVPWLLDPVKVDLSPGRLEFARRLIDLSPDAIRLNRDEFAALSGAEPDEAAARAFATRCLSTVALTGRVDIVTDGIRTARIENGHPLMDRVTAMGCAGTAVAAAFRAVEIDPLIASASALLVVGIAGEVAAASANGPGTFAPAILDALYALDRTTILARAKLETAIRPAPPETAQ